MFPSLSMADAADIVHIILNSPFHKCFLLMEYGKQRRESPKSWEKTFVYINWTTCVISSNSEYKIQLGMRV